MKVVVSGGSGLIGSALVPALLQQGHDVAVLTRSPSKVRMGRPLLWQPPEQGNWAPEVAASDAVINLAGENIGEGRWTEERKRKLENSRLDSTRALVEATGKRVGSGAVFISASAVGYYGPRGDELLDEQSPRGEGFLAQLCERWEAEAQRVGTAARLVILRFGVVIAPRGGAIQKMLLPFKLGVGGRLGDGRQWMSWVDITDVVRAIQWAISDEKAKGVYNVTSPQPVRNADFTKALGSVLHRPTLLPVPGFALRAALGQMAEEALLSGQRAVPSRTEQAGFHFESPGLESSLRKAVT